MKHRLIGNAANFVVENSVDFTVLQENVEFAKKTFYFAFIN